jgi:hypothetical protein|tara:strand:- start:355 stop:543 length:189 start_codon:yes stop_codon:yes gene_type:complete
MKNKNESGKLTQGECRSFMLDEDNKIIYPNIWSLIERHLEMDGKGIGQYLIEPNPDNHPYQL